MRLMLRIRGDHASLLAALIAHWADQQLQIPAPLQPEPIKVAVIKPVPFKRERAAEGRQRPARRPPSAGAGAV